MAEIKYLNYGNQQVDEQALLTSMANDVQEYVNSQPWSSKRKQKFMTAYSDIMSRGIQGASNNTGQWKINVGGTQIPFEQMDKKDKEMYGEAAYFIQQQMNRLATTPEIEEENKKKQLDKFTNTEDIIHNRIGQNVFGGSNWETSRWNSKDVRGEDGLLGTERRRALLAEQLEGYKNDLIQNPVDFSETGFKNIETYNALLDSAINNLRDSNVSEQDLRDSLDRIGLNYNNYFNNGSGDIYGYRTDSEGNKIPVTYGEYYSGLKAQDEAKAKAEQKKAEEAQKALDTLQIINPQEVKTNYTLEQLANKYGGDLNSIISKYQKQNISSLSQDENDELVSLFRGGQSQGALSELTDDEWNTVKSKLSLDDLNRNQYRKIDGLDGIYYDINSDNIFQIGDFSTLNSSNSNFLQDFTEEAKLAQADQRVLSEDLEPEDFLRMGAMAQDILSGIAAWEPGYGTAASGILGLTSLGTQLWADSIDESLTKWDVAKNAGINLGLTAVGLVPGLGAAAKTGKWLPKIAKWVPYLITAAQAGNIALNDDVQNSLKKATKVTKLNELTNHDLKNIAYALSVASGVSRGAAGVRNSMKYKPTVTQNTEKEAFITIKSGDKTSKIKVTEEQIKAINEAGRKGGNDKANEVLRGIPGVKSDAEVNIKFKTGRRGKVDLTNRIKPEYVTKNTGQSSNAQRYSKYLEILNDRRKARFEAKHPILYKYLSPIGTNYEIYQRMAGVSGPNLNIIDRFKQAYNPTSKFKNTTKPGSAGTTGTASTTSATGTTSSSGPSKLTKWKFNPETKEFRDILKGNSKHSGNAIQTEAFKLGNATIDVDIPTLGSYEGSVNINLNGTTQSIRFRNQKELSQKVAQFIQTRRKDIFGSKINHEKVGEALKLLKNKGVFKYGGRITDSQIDYFLKQYK